MKDYEIILKMIKEVDPNDTAKLDEIDARVTIFLHPHRDYMKHGIWNKKLWVWAYNFIQDFPYREVKPYTRSRDALKAIRPEGWKFLCGQSMQDGQNFCVCQKIGDESHIDNENSILPTEELAELHAIIQSIAYERDMTDAN